MSNNPSAEALSLLGLVADAQKFRSRLEELISKTEAADKATLALQAAEKAAEQSSAAKLQVAEALVQSLTDQADGIKASNEATASDLALKSQDLARREAELLELKQQHVDRVASALRDHERRSAELEQQRSKQDEDFHSRVEALRLVENKLRDHHSGLRSIIASARQGIAAASS